MTHNEVARDLFGVSYETIIRRILRTYDRATKSDVEAGARWYDEAGELADMLAGPDLLTGDGLFTREEVAAVISHLSPQTSWMRNVAGAVAMLREGSDAARALGCLSENVSRAADVLSDGWVNPIDSFSARANKTRSFYHNILGDREAVTVDVWACRVADLDETLLRRKGAYDMVADAYRAAARRRGVDPATMQATTWIIARNGRSS